ncbi:hypothetical protein [Streptomyces sp. NPDC017940]|uniref:hypothetical protein n=1 Tax=Streptomyces sp. NPDC017940 TaxID=3365017 RepID=UPI00379A7ECE
MARSETGGVPDGAARGRAGGAVRGEAGGDSGCHGGDDGDASRAAVLPVPEQPGGGHGQRPASVRHDSGQGLAPLVRTAAPDVSAVDLYSTRVIRT